MAALVAVLSLLLGQLFASAAGAHGDEPHPDDLPPGAQTGGSGTPCLTGSISAGSFEFPCHDVDLLGWTDLIGIPSFGNDIWGWTDPVDGTPWVMMGLFDGTAFVDLSDPESPRHAATLPTASTGSFWSDIKVHDDHAYIVRDVAGNHGLQVFHLGQLRFLNGGPVTVAATAWYTGFGVGHNLAVNEDTGYLYVLGSDTCEGGPHVLDLATPANPTFAGCVAEDGYTHDAQCVVYAGPDLDYVGREICLSANPATHELDEDTLTIVDVTDKTSMFQISRTGYPDASYAHQGWLTEDHRYFLLGDEGDEVDFGHATRTLVWDVSDLDQPVLVGHHASALASTDHNLYVRGDHVFQANYTSGLRVLRIVDPATAALEEVAYFDTYPPHDVEGTGVGAWGVYPFFDEDFVVVSDILLGLFVLRPRLVPEPAGPLLHTVAFASLAALGAIRRRRSERGSPDGRIQAGWRARRRCRDDGTTVQPPAKEPPMPRPHLVSLLCGAMLLGAVSSHAQVVDDSTVSGTLVSRSATIPTGETRAAVFEVPGNAHFVLTQACSSLVFGVIFPFQTPQWFLVGSELGTVGLTTGCTSFEPGVAFAPGEQLSCEAVGPVTSETFCLVNGVLQRADRGRGKGRH